MFSYLLTYLLFTYFDEVLEGDVRLEESLVQLQRVIVTRAESTVNRLHSLAHCSAKLRRQYSTVQYSTVQYSTVQYSTVQYSTVQYSTVQYSTVQYSTVQLISYTTYRSVIPALCAICCRVN